MLNPILNEAFLMKEKVDDENAVKVSSKKILNKLLFVNTLTLLSFVYSMLVFLNFGIQRIENVLFWGSIATFVLFSILIFKAKDKSTCPMVLCFSIVWGLSLFNIAFVSNNIIAGTIAQIFCSSILAIFAFALISKTKMLNFNNKFKALALILVISLICVYGINFALRSVNFNYVYIFFPDTVFALLLTILSILLVSLSLINNYEKITNYDGQLEKNYEWYFSFSLVLTSLWAYFESILNFIFLFRKEKVDNNEANKN